ncbi:AzlC family ABC transporter permease [Atopococcus tabaci]|uniref:AzlC family ABC transporter permease n=1 Tax=Atopococcus tabaci TaxID=269774 RepID=UPI0004264B69|nr:AzlC family ABC transporter permease [Atopococcus tabaci]
MTKKDWLEGCKQMIPVAVGYIPLGIAGGMALQSAGFSTFGIFLMSLLVYAGAAQFMTASMAAAGATVPSIILMTFFLNLRHLLMSSSISGYLKKKSYPFLLLFSHTLTDEAFGLNTHRFTTGNWSPEKGLAANILAYSSWVLSTVAGGMIGTTLHIHTAVVNYVLIAMFICMLLEQFVSKAHLVVGIVAGISAVILKALLQHNISLVIAALIASFAGYLLDSRRQEKPEKEEAMQYDK